MKQITKAQIGLIQNSWEILKQLEPVIIGDIFYSKLFLEAPQLQPMFRSPRLEQAEKLVATLTVVVHKLDKLELISRDIENLARRHVKYGVQPEHYQVVGTTLLWTLAHALKSQWNPELEEAWAICYSTLADTMIRASAEAMIEA
jgi:hemoglobin-like flavoprotein